MPPAKHILCLYLPHWSITRRYRRHPEYRQASIAVIRSIGPRRLVVDVSPQAQSHGLRRGISAAESRSLCPNLRCIDEDIAGDHRALQALGRWLIRFTPVVADGWDDPEARPAVLFLDLTGSERLFGGIDKLLERIRLAIAQFGILARMALAPTPGAAWAFAVTGNRDPSLNIAPLPVAALRLDEAIVSNLHMIGLHHVGDVLALPREQLASRFGPLLSKRLDQLTGILSEPLTKLITEPPITARMEFDAPVEALEDTWLIFEKLLALVIPDLARQNHGVRQLRLIFKPDRGWGLPTITRIINLSRPHREPATLLNLIRCETERVDLEHGFVRFQLDVPLHEPTTASQTQLFEQQSVEDKLELDRLLERLRVRLGKAAVIQPELVESYLPERAWKLGETDTKAVAIASANLLLSPRPLTLFAMPIEIRVLCEPSDDRTGRPMQFSWRGNVHRLNSAVGPERIAGEWWRGHRHTREYYDVEDADGQRFWLFRVLHVRGEDEIIARWFLHGRFE